MRIGPGGSGWLAVVGAAGVVGVTGALGLGTAVQIAAVGVWGVVVGVIVRLASGVNASSAKDIDGALMKAILDGTSDAVLCFSDNGTIRYSNRQARELFFEGKSFDGSNFLRMAQAAPEALREALVGENDRLFTVELDGWTESYHLSRVEFEIDGALYTLLVVKRMTRQVGLRDSDVQQRVVRILSHEVKNSLAPIASLVNTVRLMLGRPEHAARLTQALDTIEERATHLKVFVEGYGQLTKLPKPQRRERAWSSVLEHAASLYPQLRVRSTDAAGWFDPVQMEQVLVNLVKNSLEAGSAIEDVEVEARVLDDGTSEVEVTDRGRGLTQDAQRAALLPMYTTKEHGAGMGLALCKEIVDAHGGTLSIANRQGGGARVRLSLPARNVDLVSTHSRLTLTRG